MGHVVLFSRGKQGEEEEEGPVYAVTPPWPPGAGMNVEDPL